MEDDPPPHASSCCNHHYNGNSTIPPSPKLDFSDIELITIQNIGYTSLRDLLPSTGPPTIMSPTNSSWYEIPIKNPLVKHAALAYLQPMSTPPDPRDRGLLWRLRDACGCSENGCFCWLGDAVRSLFTGGGWNTDEEDDEDDEKVDCRALTGCS